jgi:hypothetical protein
VAVRSNRSILLDIVAWDAATRSDRSAAAETVAASLPSAFEFQGLAAYRLGTRSHEIATFSHGKARFALLPGADAATLGYDRSRPFVPTALQAASWADAEEAQGGLPDFLDQCLTPLRRGGVTPFLIEVAAWSFDYAQDGDDQADGYWRVREACSPDFRLPTCDEWEYACAAGERGLFRWGDDTPDSNSYDEKVWDLHRRPNASGLTMNASTYDCEICQGPKFRGGDGGRSVCGGEGNFASWLPLASAFQVPDDVADYWWIDDVRVRRVHDVPTP